MERELELLKRRCEPLYLKRGFHVWQHALDMERDGIWLNDTATEHGVGIDPRLMRAIPYVHDLGYALAPGHVMIYDGAGWRPARNREEVHAHLGWKLMEDIGFPSDFIYEVCSAIPATHVDGPLDTPVRRLTAGADLRPVGYGTTKQFIANTRKLHKEAKMLKGESIPYKTFVHGAISYLGRFAAKRNEHTPNYYGEGERSGWHMGAVTNMVRLARSVLRSVKVVVDISESIQPAAALGKEPVHDPETIHITIGNDYAHRVKAMEHLAGHYKRLGAPAPMTVAIPTEGKVLSLSGSMVHEIYVPIGSVWAYIQAGFPPEELKRILTKQGTLHLYDKQTDQLPHPPYKEVGDLSAIDRWLAPSGFRRSYDADRPFGWEAVYKLA